MNTKKGNHHGFPFLFLLSADSVELHTCLEIGSGEKKTNKILNRRQRSWFCLYQWL